MEKYRLRASREERGYTQAEIAKVLGITRSAYTHYESFVSGLCLGLRPEERYALDYEDLDLKSGTVTIKGAYVTASSKHGGESDEGDQDEGVAEGAADVGAVHRERHLRLRWRGAVDSQ